MSVACLSFGGLFFLQTINANLKTIISYMTFERTENSPRKPSRY